MFRRQRRTAHNLLHLLEVSEKRVLIFVRGFLCGDFAHRAVAHLLKRFHLLGDHRRHVQASDGRGSSCIASNKCSSDACRLFVLPFPEVLLYSVYSQTSFGTPV